MVSNDKKPTIKFKNAFTHYHGTLIILLIVVAQN